MGREYGTEEVLRRLIGVLGKSRAGMSGVELASAMGMSRITMSRYLASFEQQGMVHGKRMGNVTVWSVKEGVDGYSFPQDYFRVAAAYMDALTTGNAEKAVSLLESCVYFGARPARLVLECVLPAFGSVTTMRREQRIGALESVLFQDILHRSLHALGRSSRTIPTKNCILMVADPLHELQCRAVDASLRSESWNVHNLGYMSDAVDVFFDLELQKMLGRVWRGMPGIMVIIVFGGDADALRFLSNSTDTVRKKIPKNIHLAFCVETDGRLQGSDMASPDISKVMQWCETIHQNA